MTTSSGWTEVAGGVHVGRYKNHDVNATVVVGSSAALVFDTLTSVPEGRILRRHVADIVAGVPVRHVVNSHVHYDHCFGNAAFRGDRPRFWGHRRMVESFDISTAAAEHHLVSLPPRRGRAEWRTLLAGHEQERPDAIVDDFAEIDLGGRTVILRHLGRGHTDGDLIVEIPDCGVVLLGDLVKQSAPPTFWYDCYPLDWPQTVRAAAALLSPGSIAVPGHGSAVDASFMRSFADCLAHAAGEALRLLEAGLGAEGAAAEGNWPWPREHLGQLLHRVQEQRASRDAASNSEPLA